MLNTLSGVPGLGGWTFTPDGEGRPYSSTSGSSTSVLKTTYYPTAGANTTVTYANGSGGSAGDTDVYTYDQTTGRMNQFQYTVGSSAKTLTGQLGWNANWTLGTLGITDKFVSTQSQNCGYTYDALGRLGSVDCTNGSHTPWTQTFTLDAFGNISKSGTSSFQASYLLSNGTTNNQEQSVSSCIPTYDADGNLTTDCTFMTPATYSWNIYGCPITLNGVNVTCDALGREVEDDSGSSYNQILYSPIGKIGVMNGQDIVSIRTPLPGGGVQEILPAATHILHGDWLNSAWLSTLFTSRTVVNDSAYAPYGEGYEAPATDFDFTGQFQDTLSGLYDLMFRKYNPVQGRWLSPDPSGRSAVDPTNPQTWNRYAYVANSPLSYTDPLGLQSGGMAQCGPGGSANGCNTPVSYACPLVITGCGANNFPSLDNIFASWNQFSLLENPLEVRQYMCLGDCGYYVIGYIYSVGSGAGAANNGPNPVAVANSMKQYVKAQTSNCYNGFHQTTGGKVVQAFSALALFPVANNYQNNDIALAAEFLGKVSLAAGSDSAGGVFTAWLGGVTANVTIPAYVMGTAADAGALMLCAAGAATSIVP